MAVWVAWVAWAEWTCNPCPGSELNNPNMQLSLLGLVVIPELRISDKGLVDVTQFDFIPVLED